MLASQIPAKWLSPFAANATRNAIPLAPYPTGSNLASQQGGFPPITNTPLEAGGIAPEWADFQGAFYQCSSWDQWFSAGGAVYYDSAFSTAISGYPLGARLNAVSLIGAYWLNTVDGNTTNPDASGAGWTFIPPASWTSPQAAGGTANALTLTLSPTPLSLASLVGIPIKFTVTTPNTTAVLVNPNALGNLPLSRSDGNALVANDLTTGITYSAIIVSTSKVQLINSVASQTSTASASIPYCVDTSGTANIITAAPSPAITYTDGTEISVNPANSITGSTTANISAQGAISVTRPDGTAVVPGDIIARQRFNAVISVNSGTTTLQMVSWPQNAVGTPNSITGASHTYATSDAGKQSRRSNTGSAMVDLLPGATGGALPAGWSGTIVNADATALYALQVGAGSTLTGPGVSNGTIVIGPGQQVTISSNGTNYTCYGCPARAVLRANTTIYVSTTGSDTANAGVASTAAFQTGSHAYAWAQQYLDLAGFQLTISILAGAYSAGISCSGPLLGQASPVIFQGAGSGSTTISPSTATAFAANAAAQVEIAAATLTSTFSGGSCVSSIDGGTVVTMGAGLIIGASPNYQIFTIYGGKINITASYTISGGSAAGHYENFAGQTIVTSGITVTLVGSLNFSAFASADFSGGSLLAAGITFAGTVGSCTGARYAAQYNGLVFTQGGGANYFPGSIAGSAIEGGVYG